MTGSKVLRHGESEMLKFSFSMNFFVLADEPTSIISSRIYFAFGDIPKVLSLVVKKGFGPRCEPNGVSELWQRSALFTLFGLVF